MCISGLVRNMNEWKSTGRKKKALKTSSHSECHQPGQHIFLYVLHDSLDLAITTYHEVSVSSYMQLCSVSIALNWYASSKSLWPGFSTYILTVCVICFSLPMWKCAGCYENLLRKCLFFIKVDHFNIFLVQI